MEFPFPVAADADGAGACTIGIATATGPRAENQDRAAAGAWWAILADGVGGTAGGATAAASAVDAAVGSLRGERRVDASAVERAIRAANTAVRLRQEGQRSLARMATTLIVAAASEIGEESSTWIVGNVGDSPGWLVCNRGWLLVTEIHNAAAEMQRAGALTAEQARHHAGRHRVTRAIGVGSDVTPSVTRARLYPGDRLVLASDGVEALAPEAMHDIVSRSGDAQTVADALVREAEAMATDNVTVVVVEHPSPVSRRLSRPC